MFCIANIAARFLLISSCQTPNVKSQWFSSEIRTHDSQTASCSPRRLLDAARRPPAASGSHDHIGGQGSGARDRVVSPFAPLNGKCLAQTGLPGTSQRGRRKNKSICFCRCFGLTFSAPLGGRRTFPRQAATSHSSRSLSMISHFMDRRAAPRVA